MATVEEILTAVQAHCVEGMQKHPDFTTPHIANQCLHERLQKLTNAIAQPDCSRNPTLIAKRILEIAAVCVKTLINLDMPLTTPIQDQPTTQPHPEADSN